MELLALKEVSKDFGKRRVLSDVNLSIDEGDIFGVIGESGSGKTTLLNMLVGFLEPTQGKALYFAKTGHEAKDLNRNLSKIKKFLGFTPQHNSFYPKLTVEENLFHFGQLYGLSKETLKHNVDNILQSTELYDHRHKLAEHLSGGMQKRLDISCSMVHKPKILVLDEPTADLDPVLQKEISWLLQEANKQGITIIIASHDLESIENICNKVAIVHKGRVFSQGLLDDVKKPYFHDHFTINLRPGESKERILAALKTLPIKRVIDEGHTLIIYPADTEKTVSSLLNYIRQENLYLHEMDMRKPSLHEIFERIVRE